MSISLPFEMISFSLFSICHPSIENLLLLVPMMHQNPRIHNLNYLFSRQMKQPKQILSDWQPHQVFHINRRFIGRLRLHHQGWWKWLRQSRSLERRWIWTICPGCQPEGFHWIFSIKFQRHTYLKFCYASLVEYNTHVETTHILQKNMSIIHI